LASLPTPMLVLGKYEFISNNTKTVVKFIAFLFSVLILYLITFLNSLLIVQTYTKPGRIYLSSGNFLKFRLRNTRTASSHLISLPITSAVGIVGKVISKNRGSDISKNSWP